MDNICIECRNSADCKRKPRTDQWTVAGCSWFEADTVITNADLVRQMTVEELAIFCEDGCPPGAPICNSVKTIEGETTKERCQRCWLSWLKSPVEADE